MYKIKKMAEFEVWFSGIRDSLTRRRLGARLRKVALGNFGDIAPIADVNGLWEMREHFGAGCACITCSAIKWLLLCWVEAVKPLKSQI